MPVGPIRRAASYPHVVKFFYNFCLLHCKRISGIINKVSISICIEQIELTVFPKCLRVHAPRHFLSSASDIEAHESNAPGEDFSVQHDAAVRNKMLRECVLWAFLYRWSFAAPPTL